MNMHAVRSVEALCCVLLLLLLLLLLFWCAHGKSRVGLLVKKGKCSGACLLTELGRCMSMLCRVNARRACSLSLFVVNSDVQLQPSGTNCTVRSKPCHLDRCLQQPAWSWKWQRDQTPKRNRSLSMPVSRCILCGPAPSHVVAEPSWRPGGKIL